MTHQDDPGNRRTLDIDTILGDQEEYFDDSSSSDASGDAGEENIMSKRENNENLVFPADHTEIELELKKPVSDIDAILGDQEEYLDYDSGNDKDITDFTKIESKEYSEENELLLGSTQPISDVDAILGVGNNATTAAKDVDNISEPFKFNNLPSFPKPEVNFAPDVKTSVLDIDAILGDQDEYFDDDVEDNDHCGSMDVEKMNFKHESDKNDNVNVQIKSENKASELPSLNKLDNSADQNTLNNDTIEAQGKVMMHNRDNQNQFDLNTSNPEYGIGILNAPEYFSDQETDEYKPMNILSDIDEGAGDREDSFDECKEIAGNDARKISLEVSLGNVGINKYVIENNNKIKSNGKGKQIENEVSLIQALNDLPQSSNMIFINANDQDVDLEPKKSYQVTAAVKEEIINDIPGEIPFSFENTEGNFALSNDVSRRIQMIHQGETDADINIMMSLDLGNKEAIFAIRMQDGRDVNEGFRQKDDKNENRERDQEYHVNGRQKEKFNVNVGLFLKEREISVEINSKPIPVQKETSDTIEVINVQHESSAPKNNETIPGTSDKIDKDLSRNNSTKKYYLRYQLPPSNDNSKFEAEKRQTEDLPKRYDFRYKLQLPEFLNSLMHSNEDENTENHKSDSGIKRYDFRYQLPKFEFPTFDLTKRLSNSEEENIIEVKEVLSESAPNQVESPKRFDFRYQLPSIQFPSFGATETQDHVTDVESGKADVGSERFDFRFQLPKFELLSFGSKDDNLNSDGAPNPEEETENKDGGFKIFDFQFSFPDFEWPFLGTKDSPSEGNPPVLEAEQDKVDNSTKRFDFRYQLPSFGWLSFDSTSKSPIQEEIIHENIDSLLQKPFDYEVETKTFTKNFNVPTEALANTYYGSSDEHSDIDLYPSPTKIVHLTNFSPLVSIYMPSYSRPSSPSSPESENPSISHEEPIELEKDPDESELDVSTNQNSKQYIKSEFQTISPSLSLPITNVKYSGDCGSSGLTINKPLIFSGHYQINKEDNNFTIIFDDDSIGDHKFQVKLSDDTLVCCEYHSNTWQPQIKRKVDYICPDRDFRIIIVPESHNRIMILLNAEMVLECRLMGSIDTLKRLSTEGSVELCDVKET